MAFVWWYLWSIGRKLGSLGTKVQRLTIRPEIVLNKPSFVLIWEFPKIRGQNVDPIYYDRYYRDSQARGP